MLSCFVYLFSDLGVHVDGFISNVAHSFVVGVTKVKKKKERKKLICFHLHFLICIRSLFTVCLQEKPLTGRKADVMIAAHLCAEAALRLVKPGNQVTLLYHHI